MPFYYFIFWLLNAKVSIPRCCYPLERSPQSRRPTIPSSRRAVPAPWWCRYPLIPPTNPSKATKPLSLPPLTPPREPNKAMMPSHYPPFEHQRHLSPPDHQIPSPPHPNSRLGSPSRSRSTSQSTTAMLPLMTPCRYPLDSIHNPICVHQIQSQMYRWAARRQTSLTMQPCHRRYTWSKERKKIELVIENEQVKNEPSLAIKHHGWSLFWDWNGDGEMLKRWTH